MDELIKTLVADKDAAVQLAQVLAKAVDAGGDSLRAVSTPAAEFQHEMQLGHGDHATEGTSEPTVQDALSGNGAQRVMPTGVSGVSALKPARAVGGSDPARMSPERHDRGRPHSSKKSTHYHMHSRS